ncbi:hypothetical protein A3C37_04735 [Candidatus Peribacteria bacterium RIFCSPHIGHO2_02_FULL_53_20]|nr:MAG: hypothetical protein A3C37_04735 [Candidatus Peribacteria bacterium RIFCSPHIGHO2_02_FULL_53_20]OGJ66225.1 MAG: hypothetical protein A3B61_02255 [Candidatus Peribacteria bacterium RIFCSPLOWO2_01_FULL_53_10]OGJ72793.1 MAG: hypothetical protein A3G69_01140 [Candidatus Peribacteria bacterium RIFCSPLOWO2_12_FULL_53_10]
MALSKATLDLLVEGDLPHIEANCTPEDVSLFHQAIGLLVPETDGTIPQDRVQAFYAFALKDHGSFERSNASGDKAMRFPKASWLKQFAMEYRQVLTA